MMPARVGLRILVAVSSLMAPILAGCVIYYSLRRTHPTTANLANWMSFAGFFAANGLVPWDWAQADRLVIALVVGLGILGAEVSIRLIRETPIELDRDPRRSGAA